MWMALTVPPVHTAAFTHQGGNQEIRVCTFFFLSSAVKTLGITKDLTWTAFDFHSAVT